jgi:SHS2 domain-containing protein
MKFEFIDITTSDAAFKAYGETLGELFANAALAMFEVMIKTEDLEEKELREVEIEGRDLESLMFNWLNELLFYVDAEYLAFRSFEVEVDEKKNRLQAVCKGEEIDRARHEVRTVVKSATYHKMRVEKDHQWWAQVIVDI